MGDENPYHDKVQCHTKECLATLVTNYSSVSISSIVAKQMPDTFERTSLLQVADWTSAAVAFVAQVENGLISLVNSDHSP